MISCLSYTYDLVCLSEETVLVLRIDTTDYRPVKSDRLHYAIEIIAELADYRFTMFLIFHV
ncbi:hypothetical protein BaRGS_00001644, partial [Batillaria attramentaria]